MEHHRRRKAGPRDDLDCGPREQAPQSGRGQHLLARLARGRDPEAPAFPDHRFDPDPEPAGRLGIRQASQQLAHPRRPPHAEGRRPERRDAEDPAARGDARVAHPPPGREPPVGIGPEESEAGGCPERSRPPRRRMERRNAEHRPLQVDGRPRDAELGGDLGVARLAEPGQHLPGPHDAWRLRPDQRDAAPAPLGAHRADAAPGPSGDLGVRHLPQHADQVRGPGEAAGSYRIARNLEPAAARQLTSDRFVIRPPRTAMRTRTPMPCHCRRWPRPSG